MTQELYHHLPATIHTQSDTEKLRTESACMSEIKTERRENETGVASGARTDAFSRRSGRQPGDGPRCFARTGFQQQQDPNGTEQESGSSNTHFLKQ
jgi:hypothetical protein